MSKTVKQSSTEQNYAGNGANYRLQYYAAGASVKISKQVHKYISSVDRGRSFTDVILRLTAYRFNLSAS